MLKLLVFSKNVAEQKIIISLGFSNSSNNAAEQVWFWIPKIFFKNELYHKLLIPQLSGAVMIVRSQYL